MKLDKYFEVAKQLGFSDIEFKSNKNKKLSMTIFHHKVENYTVSENETIYIRGIVGGKMVSGTTENPKSIERILKEMVESSTYIEQENKQEIFAGSESYKHFKTYKDDLNKVSASDKIELCLLAEKKTYEYSEKVSDCEVSYNEIESAMNIVNSKGLRLSYKVNYATLVVECVAKDLDDTRTGFKYQIVQNLNEFDVDKLVKEASDDAINALHGSQCNSGKYNVLIAPNVFSSLVSILVSNASGEAVNKQRTLLKDKLNQEIASKKFTLVEDPHKKEYPYFYRSFDDEGVATFKKPIIEKGVLKTFLYNIEAAKVANVSSTGNGYGGSNISISTAFLCVKPGKKSKEELCKQINNGVLISSVAGLHSGMNQLSGDFSLQASGYRIENGKITSPVNLITIAGNLFELFKNITEIGNDETLTYGGVLTPSVVVKNLAISGK